MKSFTGQLLAAIPELSDSNFFRTVVLIFQHDPSGASGVILNRPTPVALSDVWEQINQDTQSSEIQDDVEDAKGSSPISVTGNLHIGGPVEGPLMAVHGCPWAGEIEIMEGVYVAMKRENLDEIIKQDLRPYRFFSGYSGWSSDQLNSEIQAGGWLTCPATYEQIFESDPESLWKSVCAEVGESIMLPAIGNGPKPPDSQWN